LSHYTGKSAVLPAGGGRTRQLTYSTQCMDWVCWYYTWVLSAWILDIGTLLGYSVHGLGMLVQYWGTQCMDSGDWYSTGVLWYLQSNVGTMLL
jgi:hypothetical protein